MSSEHNWTYLPLPEHARKLGFSLIDQQRECKRCGTIMSEMDFSMLAELFGVENCNEALAGRVINE